MQIVKSVKAWWQGYRAEQARVRRLNAQLDNLTDYGLIDRILAGEK